MAATYTPIASITLGTATSSVTFSSIPSTYTDLILIMNGASTSGGQNYEFRFNSDTGSNYSNTRLIGNGSTAASYRGSNETTLNVGGIYTDRNTIISQIMNYSNATTNKTVISRSNSAGNNTGLFAGLWRNTAAINTILVTLTGSDTFVLGSTFDLYGILGANA